MAQNWLRLGISLGSLAEIPSGIETVRALAQLLLEQQYAQKHEMEKQNFVINKIQKEAKLNKEDLLNCFTEAQDITTALLNQKQQQALAEKSPIKPQLVTDQSKKVQFTIYQKIHIGAELDLIEVATSLCEVLSLIYNKFMDSGCSQTHIFRIIQQIDNDLKNIFIKVLMNEISKQLNLVVEKEIQGVYEMLHV